jgi:hypothetical protein
MQSLPQSAAVRDRAERHLFGVLPGLAATDRRALALVDLAGADRAAAARDTGLAAGELAAALARARKALRRSRAPLAAGARCERAELLLSDQLDGAIDWRDRRWLDIHMERCPRCREHETILEEARSTLRESFAASEAPPAPAPPRAPEPESPPSRDDRSAKLRVVPPAPPPLEPSAPAPAPRVPAPVPARRPTARQPAPAAAPKRHLPAAVTRTAKVVAVLLILAAIIAGIGIGLHAAFGPKDSQTAPWTKHGAPNVPPQPLSQQ